MKKLLMFLILGMVLFSLTTVSASWGDKSFIPNTHRTKLPNEITNYGTYQLTEHSWYDPLKIFKAKRTKDVSLENNTEQCTDCLADGSIVLYEDGKLMDNVLWKRSFDGGKTFVDWTGFTNWQVYVENKNRYIQQDVYKTVCKPTKEINENGTAIQDCSQIKTGTRTIDTGEWNKLDFNKVYPADTYKWKIEGGKKSSTYLDWIIQTDGQILNGWAVWGNISLGDDAEVILNSPNDNNITLTNLVTFNATANVTGGAYLTNMSLYTNESGSWGKRNTTDLGENQLDEDLDYTSTTTISDTAWRAQRFKVKGNFNTYKLTTVAINTVETGREITYLMRENLTGSNLSVKVNSSTVDGLTFVDFTADNLYLNNDTRYYLIAYASGGSSIQLREDGVGDEYTDGIKYYSSDSGDSWNTDATVDFAFEINSIGYPTTPTQTWTNDISSDIIWNVQACDSDGDCGFATSNYSLFIDTTAPNVTIDYPTGTIDSLTDGQTLDLNYSISDSNLDSCWYEYPKINETYYSSSKTFQNLNGTMNIFYYDGVLDGTNTTSVNIPLNCTDTDLTIYKKYTSNFLTHRITYLCKIDDSNNYTLFEYDNGEIPQPAGSTTGYYFNNIISNCSANTTFTYVTGLNNITVYANDSVGNLGSDTSSWDASILITGENYSDTALITDISQFVINLTTPTEEIPVAYLYYNGTPILGTRTGTTTEHSFTASKTMTTIGTNSFYWTISYDGNEYNSSTHQQNVTDIIDASFVEGDCSAGLTKVMNFTFANAENLTALGNITLQYDFRYGLSNNSGKTTSGSLNNIAEFSVCMNTSQSPYYNIGYGEIQYSRTGYSQRRYYVFENTRLTNATINTTLYSLPSGDSTSFLIEVRSPELSPYVSKYLSVMRWYPELNEYKVIEMGRTDDKGQTVAKVKIEDVDYRIGLYQQNGSLIYLAEPIRMVCLATPCSYTINVPTTRTDDFDEVQGIEAEIIYSNGIFTLTYNDPSQNTDTMALKVYRIGAAETLICNSNGTSFTGILSCNVSTETGTLKAMAIRTASPERPIALLIIDTLTTPFTGTFGLFWQFIIIVVLAFLGIVSPIVTIILGIIALVFGALVFKTITYPILIGIAVLGGIVIHFMRQNTGR